MTRSAWSEFKAAAKPGDELAALTDHEAQAIDAAEKAIAAEYTTCLDIKFDKSDPDLIAGTDYGAATAAGFDLMRQAYRRGALPADRYRKAKRRAGQIAKLARKNRQYLPF